MQLKQVMTKKPIVLNPDDLIVDAAKKFRKNRINGAPVVKKKKLLGLLTNRNLLDFMEVHEFGKQLLWPAPFDLIEAMLDYQSEMSEVKREFEKLKKNKVEDVMDDKPVTGEPGMHVTEAADLMTEKNLTHLPVLEKGKLVGLVTRSDLLKGLTSD